MTTTINNEHEKNQGRKVLNVPNKREQNQTCLDSAEREGLRQKGNVPNLRFPEFEGEWEKCKLGDLCNVLMCKRILASQTNTEEGVPFYKIGTIGNAPDAYISKELFDDYKTKYNYPHKGEVMITCAGTVGKCVIYDGKDAYYQDSNIVWIDNPSQCISNSFLYHLLAKVDWRKLNSTTIIRIYNDDLRNLKLNYPQIEEQQKISRLLSLLDERIATQNKVIDKLQSLIRGLNNKIFATIQGGKYKLGDIATITNGNSNVQDASTKYKEGLYPFFDRSDDTKFLPTFLFNKEAIIYPGEGTEFMPRYYNGKFALHQRCYAIFDFKDFVSPLFMYFLLQTKNAYFIRNAVGSTVPSLRLNTFQNLKVIIPEEKVQRNIYLFLIDFEQKLNIEIKFAKSLLQQKQYLLRQMFI